MPQTKIVATIGPASESEEVLRALIAEGLSVMRLNFAHGRHEEHAAKIRLVRELSAEMGYPVAILQDLGGPKVRVCEMPEGGARLVAGKEFTLDTDGRVGDERRVSTTYPALASEVSPGDPILLADGMLEIEVVCVEGSRITCRVVTGGILTSHKGINLPTRTLHTPSLTEKDREDLAFGLSQGVDYVGVSFVRSAADILMVKECMGDCQVPVVAKIEKHEAVDAIDEILEVADAIMVARGDLGVEIPLEQVPEVQKMLIRKANARGRPVITATQMLRSMVDSPRPTRAEATDVANAVLDGTDAVMLSEETASGAYPVAAVRYMSRITHHAENEASMERFLSAILPKKDVSESVAHASCVLAHHLGAQAIVASTVSGMTARHISRYRPHMPILALSPSLRTIRQLTLYWGCVPVLVPPPEDADDLIETSAQMALASGIVSRGDLVIITAGHPVGGAGTTNMLRVKILD